MSSNSGSLAKAGYSFNGWNTAANGSGTAYAENSSIIFSSSNIVLYGNAVAVLYLVTYNANTGTGTQTDSSSP